MAAIEIPLFPLGLVLYPGVMLPLHIFEERYRRLVRGLLDQQDGTRVFGVVAIKAGREVGTEGITALHEIGCTAELRFAEAYQDGRFDIIATGTTRFRLLQVRIPRRCGRRSSCWPTPAPARRHRWPSGWDGNSSAYRGRC